MRFSIYPNTGILVVILVFFSACDLINKDQTLEVPEPVIVSAQDIPVDIYASEDVYFLVRHDSTMNKWEEGAGSILEELMKSNFHPQQAWFPIGVTRCMAPNVHEAFIVQLEKPDKQILEHGFITGTDSLNLNCGIEEFKYYSF